VKTAYLGLGSNLGDRLGTLRAALERLRADPAIRLAGISSVYETAPVGVVTQPHFLNLVVELATTRLPRALLATTASIETALGRERRERWGPRTLDIDVLWYDGVRSDDPVLTLPHPRMHERSFVLTPLAELAPDLELGGERIAVLAARLDQSGLVRRGAWAEAAPSR
jgi:2-amino-4-hydroxy-6-hydroxymethyldihydropteridine diphosphokinase